MSFATMETGGSVSLLPWHQVRLLWRVAQGGAAPVGTPVLSGTGSLLISILVLFFGRSCTLCPVVAMASPGPHEAAHRLGCLPPVPSPWLSGENWKLKGTKGRRDLPPQFCGLCGSIWKPPHDALNCD